MCVGSDKKVQVTVLWAPSPAPAAPPSASAATPLAGSDLLRAPCTSVTKLMRTPWERGIEAADRNNKPGLFTAFIGFEWTQHVQGNNQHRVVVIRDGADRAK